MHGLFLGISFVELVALILLPGFVFYFITKKKASVRENVEIHEYVGDADTGTFSLLTAPTQTKLGGSNSSPTKTNRGAVSTKNRYEVFLSFRGSDTRKCFTDQLHHALFDAGIDAFRDDDEFCQGENIKPELLAAMRNSKILIPILSVNYGTSGWCLNELVQIMECKDNNRQRVLPIFYKVEPAEVRHQIGNFGNAFCAYERRLLKWGFDRTILEKWKKALFEISSVTGYEAKADGYDAMMVKSIVQKMLSELNKKFELVIYENLVGIDSHVKFVMKFLDNNSRATLFIGIYGMGGIGKTTLAKAIYDKLSNQFEHHSFIADIRESRKYGLHYLQNQLIYDILKQENEVHNKDEGAQLISSTFKGKKVLILLDDVNDDDELKALVGNHNWFSSGSRILITTRNYSVLKNATVDLNYELEEMDYNHSIVLFSRHAFQSNSPPSEFEDAAHDVITTIGGLPLFIKVLGSFLCGKKLAFWRGTIDKLKKVPQDEVREKLRISYEELDYGQKQIFLDIACFFIGTDIRITSYMWDACGFFPEKGIEVLRFMSLINIGDDHKLIMHDQLRDLGREIICKENQQESKYSSRLWDPKEVQKVLKKNKGTDKIEALCLNFERHTSVELTPEDFVRVPSIRYLQLDHANIAGDFADVFPELRWLRWRGCPQRLKVTNLYLEYLIVLDLSWSKVTKDWEGWDQIKMNNLRVLDLTGCADLLVTPKFSGCKNLAILILERCSQLVKIDHSIGDLQHLITLNLKFCTELSMLPVEVGRLTALQELLMDGTSVQEIPVSIGNLKQLETLSASNCFSLSQLPRTICHLTNISLLSLDGTRITALPNSVGELVRLKHLSLKDCCEIRKLPNSIGNIGRSLVKLDVSGTGVVKFPHSLKNLHNLKVLRMDSCFFREFPPDIGELTSLQEIHACWCRSLQGGIPSEIGKLHNLRILSLRHSTISSISAEIHQLSNLQTLDLLHCDMIKELPGLPSSITVLYVDDELKSSHLPQLGKLCHCDED